LITTPLGYAVEPIERSAFRSLKIRIPRPIATGLTKIRAGYEPIDRHLHLQFELAHRTHVRMSC